MGVQAVSVGLVERLLADLLEAETAHHRVEEDLQEVHVVAIVLLHYLHPLNRDGVLSAVELSFVNWKLGDLLEGENTKAPVNEELKLFFDLVTADLQHLLAHLSRVVRDLRLKLDGVLVDTLDVLGVEVDREVICVELLQFSFCLGGSGGLLGEHICNSCSFHS